MGEEIVGAGLAPIESGDSDTVGPAPRQSGDDGNWRDKYHTVEEVRDAPEPTFLIQGFLQKDIVTALAAPVAQRKTILAWNVVRSVLTGEPFLDYFEVTEKPERVLYLCPEMGVRAIARMIRGLDIMDYLGKTLFLRSMNSEGSLLLSELTTTELRDSLLVVDTATRFLQGDENSAEHTKQFSEECFDVMRANPAAMLILYHSGKGTKTTDELSLENALRGSGELGAAISSCWATRLQDPDPTQARITPSYLLNVKQRDFASKAFEATSGPDYRMHFVAGSEGAKIVAKAAGSKPDQDGKQSQADALIRANWDLSGPKLAVLLKAAGISRGANWVAKAKTRLHLADLDAKGPHGVKVKSRK